jgi:hypothetical protein
MVEVSNRQSSAFGPVVAGIVYWMLLAATAALPPIELQPSFRGTLIPELHGWVLLFFGFYGVVFFIQGAIEWGGLAWLAGPYWFLGTWQPT